MRGRQEPQDLPIADYGLIGDTRTAALVGSNGSIDWWCVPDFDGPAVFCRLLDARQGGFFCIRPVRDYRAERAYIPDTGVLTNTFTTDDGRVRVTDLMPLTDFNRTSGDAGESAGAGQIVRRVDGVAGNVELDIAFRPTFDYARARDVVLDPTPQGAIARRGGESLLLAAPVAFSRSGPGELRARLRLTDGERAFFVLRHHQQGPDVPPGVETAAFDKAHERTIETWRAWAGACIYEGPYRGWVRRSALTLKLLTPASTGAVLPAPTTSLPEEIGGCRNWDYRFTWLRDSALILYALQSVGYHHEAQRFWDWLTGLCIECRQDLRVLHTIRGRSPPPESALDHLSGYRNSQPVRIGNAAADQRQTDIYGEVLDAAHYCIERMGKPRAEFLSLLDDFARQAAHRWREPDRGIWEIRGAPRHFLHSKLLCWVALDRARKLGRDREGHFARECGEIRRAILRDGYDAQLGAFTQALGSSILDASALLIPMVGFLPATDPRVRSTVQRIRERLTTEGLVYRYLNEDGLTGSEATFALCSAWLVDNLALAGQVDEACALFEQLTGYANDLGLLSEEIDPTTRELLGNFPQGYTHLALIRSALQINRCLAAPGPRGGAKDEPHPGAPGDVGS